MSSSDFLPDLPNYDPNPADGVRVGESPAPGLTLKRILRGHKDYIGRIAWSPNGSFLASPSEDKTIRIWDVSRGECTTVLEGHKYMVKDVAWSPEGQFLASASSDETIHLWNANNGKHLQTLQGHSNLVNSITWSPDGQYLASSSQDKTIRLWNASNGKHLQTLQGHDSGIYSVAWSPDGQHLASASGGNTIRLWNVSNGKHLTTLRGHKSSIYSVAWSPDGQHLASASGDTNIHIWKVSDSKVLQILEGHSGVVKCAVFSAGGLWLVSKGLDAIRLWRCNTWDCIAVLKESESNFWPSSCAFHPQLLVLATLCEDDTGIRIWELNEDILLEQATTDSVSYTTAKIALFGDSGVGKTGLGWRLAHNKFKEHASTYGRQFWVIDELCETRDDGTECEAVLWDLAWQDVYSPIYSTFLDKIDVFLVLFDPANRPYSLKEAQFWLEKLKRKEQLPPSLLVGARIDRGGLIISKKYLEEFCWLNGISGGYVGTSAKTGEGLDELIQKIKSQIPWDEMTTTVTTVTFKRIKDYVLALKEKTDRKEVLVQPSELRQQLQSTDPDWQFTDAEMMIAVGHLETHGYVTILKSSAGDSHILLTPYLLVELASSIVVMAGKHPRELGAISESKLLQGEYNVDELEGLEESEKRVLFDAVLLRFLEHKEKICFRETLGTENLLIFPELIKEKRPLIDDFETEDDIFYIVRGSVEEVYAGLVVLLGYTQIFTRINQWQNQAQYEINAGEICGFRQIEGRAGEIELILYYAAATPKYARNMFQGLFEKFLYQRDVDVTPYPPLYCSKNHLQERATVIKRLRDQKDFLCCEECGERITLLKFEQPLSLGERDLQSINRAEALANLRKSYEMHLSRVKSFRRDRVSPRCFISCLPDQSDWITQLASDLRNAGVYIVENCTQVKSDDFILLLKTPDYSQAWNRQSDSLSEDIALVQSRLNQIQQTRTTVVPLLRNGTPHSTRLTGLKGIRAGDFRDQTQYSVALYDLVLTLYAISFNHPAFKPLRETLQQQWKQTLSQLPPEDMKPEKRPLKVFISYAHRDEEFKDELVITLTSMQRRGLIDAWQDRQIEPGEEWYQAIKKAMNECDLALLLVSRSFLASRFINEEELTHLFQRRKEEGMRVVPIIIRPCTWQSEPILKDLQAMPKDGKAVITFPENTGERDQAWTDIAKVLEKFAKELRGDDA